MVTLTRSTQEAVCFYEAVRWLGKMHVTFNNIDLLRQVGATFYQLRGLKQGDNALGSVHPSVRPSVHVSVLSQLNSGQGHPLKLDNHLKLFFSFKKLD